MTVTIASFATFAGLLVAAGRLAADPGILNQGQVLADLAADARTRAAALRDAGLTSLVQEIADQAEELALHFTHPGRARDDAIAVFWQVAPAALDAAAFAELDPDRTADRMVAAVKASPLAHDFRATVLAEPFLRVVARQSLALMLSDPSFAAASPDPWRAALRRHRVRIDLSGR